MISFRSTVVALALVLGIQVSTTVALEPDEFDGDQLNASIWTTYNPDYPNVQGIQQGGIHLVDLPEGKAHHMWHKPGGAVDADGWNYAYRIYQPLTCPSEKYEVEAKFSDLPIAGKEYQLIGIFVGYDDAESNRQWPFHTFACQSGRDTDRVYVYHHFVKENSYTNGVTKTVFSTCPNIFRLKYDGSHYNFTVIYQGSSELDLIQDSIVSAGTYPQYIGLFVGNMKHYNDPAPAFRTGIEYFRIVDPPTIICPADITLCATTGCTANVPNDFVATATDNDNCGNSNSWQVPHGLNGPLDGLGDHAVVFSTSNRFGNIAECSTTVMLSDPDNDGVCGDEDLCPETEQDAPVNRDGCSVEQLCPCGKAWENHLEYANCVADATEYLVAAELITEEEKYTFILTAVQSNCGRNPFDIKDVECDYAYGGFDAYPEALRCAVFQNDGKLGVDSSFVFGNLCMKKFELKASGGNPIINGGIILNDFGMLYHPVDVQAATTEGYHIPAWKIDPGLLDNAYDAYAGVRDDIEREVTTNMCEFTYVGNLKIEQKVVDLSGGSYVNVTTGLGFSHNDGSLRGLHCVIGNFEIKESTVKLPELTNTVFAVAGGRIQLDKAVIEAIPGNVLFATIPNQASREVGEIKVQNTEANATFLGDKSEVTGSVVRGMVIGGQTEDLKVRNHANVICKSPPDTPSMEQCENAYHGWGGDSDRCAVFQYAGKIEIDNSFVFGKLCAEGSSEVKVGGSNPIINGGVVYRAGTTLDSEAKVKAATTQYVLSYEPSQDFLIHASGGYDAVYDIVHPIVDNANCEYIYDDDLKIEDDSQTVKLSDTGVATSLGFTHSHDKSNGLYCVYGNFEIKQTVVEFESQAVVVAIGGKLKLEKVTLISKPGDVLLITLPNAEELNDLVVKDSTVTASVLAYDGKIDIDGSKVHGQVIGNIYDVKVRNEAQVLCKSLVDYL